MRSLVRLVAAALRSENTAPRVTLITGPVWDYGHCAVVASAAAVAAIAAGLGLAVDPGSLTDRQAATPYAAPVALFIAVYGSGPRAAASPQGFRSERAVFLACQVRQVLAGQELKHSSISCLRHIPQSAAWRVPSADVERRRESKNVAILLGLNTHITL